MLCSGSQVGLPDLPHTCFFLPSKLSHRATQVSVGQLVLALHRPLAAQPPTQPLSHFASSVGLSHCCLCTAAVPRAPLSSRLWDSPFMSLSRLESSHQPHAQILRDCFGKED